ncbi:MAG: hypothetical protein B7Z38_01365 [Rhodobacterales bacterium 12-64-8]|nr:MAG: hypothetical protein B7Z38_01365 [Rhodobacterales bacterium 12-64-8]OYX46098.1 MAG: hypothetical protein B7Y90_16945 [Alphaproteobacteria bacterium 32-64-14]
MTVLCSIRLFAVSAACITLCGCINWQAAYDSAARRDCNDVIAADARQECLAQVERNASERRAEQRT